MQTHSPGMKVANAFIGPLQGAAVYFNLVGGLSVFSEAHVTKGNIKAWAQAFDEDSLGAKWASGQALAKANLAKKAASNGMDRTIALCLFVCSFGFFWLTLNSFKHVYNDMIQIGLLAMEVALVVFIYTMCQGVSKRFFDAKAAAAAKNIADGIVVADASPELLLVVAEACEAECPPDPFQTAAAPYLASAYVAALDKWRNEVHKKLKTKAGRAAAAASLSASTEGLALQGRLEAVLVLLNVIAWVGYAVFPLTYLVPEATIKAHFGAWPGNDDAEWLGNFMGDFAWTLEPALVLFVKPLIEKSVAAKKKTLLEAEKKAK